MEIKMNEEPKEPYRIALIGMGISATEIKMVEFMRELQKTKLVELLNITEKHEEHKGREYPIHIFDEISSFPPAHVNMRMPVRYDIPDLDSYKMPRLDSYKMPRLDPEQVLLKAGKSYHEFVSPRLNRRKKKS
jgi:hypothetical protein